MLTKIHKSLKLTEDFLFGHGLLYVKNEYMNWADHLNADGDAVVSG